MVKFERLVHHLTRDDYCLQDEEYFMVPVAKQAAKAIELYAEINAACEMGAQVQLPELLTWIADRFEHVYGENPSVDFVLTIRERAKRLREAMDALAVNEPHIEREIKHIAEG